MARECHAEMYEHVGESQTSTMEEWEDILTNDVYDIEENVETFLLYILLLCCRIGCCAVTLAGHHKMANIFNYYSLILLSHTKYIIFLILY